MIFKADLTSHTLSASTHRVCGNSLRQRPTRVPKVGPEVGDAVGAEGDAVGDAVEDAVGARK